MEQRATKSISRDIIGNYRKRSVNVRNTGEHPVTVRNDPHWSGGSRTWWTFYRASGNRWIEADVTEAGTETTRKREDGSDIVGLAGPLTEIVLHDGYVAVSNGYFMGQTATMTIVGKAKDIALLDR